MSAKRRPQPLKPARSVAEVSDPTVIPVDFLSGAAEAEAIAETHECYNYLRQSGRDAATDTNAVTREHPFQRRKKETERAW
jgi:hypothetical protein